MSKPSVFEKKYGQEDGINDVSGILDQFNLPPAFIEYVRKNKRTIQIVISVVVVLVVSLTLYKSYREKKIDQAAQALSLASMEQGEKKMQELQAVAKQYSDTTSSDWAKIEIAHQNMKNALYAESATVYQEIANKVGEKNALYPLALFGLAQAEEAAGKYKEALAHFDKIKLINGYQGIGFAGAARIHERQGNNKEALEIYEIYLGELADYPATYPEKILVEENIARLKSKE